MNKFAHIDVVSLAEAIPLLEPATQPIAGGTDLIPLMKEGLASPTTVLNLKQLGDLHFLHEDEDGLHIGALTTLAELDRSPIVRSGYAALADAAGQAASPQLRNTATIGGNLLQQVRCWYYRGDFHCWMKGGDECQARGGENQFHAIWDQSPCVAVHPSDPPAALVALGAELRIAGTQGERTLAIADFLQPPTDERRSLHTLEPEELIVEIIVPRSSSRSVYLKAMDRGAWAYALVSVAAAARVQARRVEELRIVLGGVANTPLRVTTAERLVEGQTLDEALIQRAGEAAIAGALPLRRNGYKLPLARNLVAQALRDLVAPAEG